MRRLHSGRRFGNDRGSTAVEFALVVPVILLIVFGAIEFGRLYNEQISLTSAARSAARVMAIGNDQGAAVTAAINSAPALNPAVSSAQVAFSAPACAAGGTMTVTISYQAQLLTGWFGASLPLQGVGAMPCGG
jgi:Flp pilus assembly protein TadG